jgi:hypothetical protein
MCRRSIALLALVIWLPEARAQHAIRSAAAHTAGAENGVVTFPACAAIEHAARAVLSCPAPQRPDRGAPPSTRRRMNASAWSIAASAALPGTGQAMLGLDRFIPYAAFEAYEWSQFAAHSRESSLLRSDYRNLSARVARSAFTIVFAVGNWDYYERMEHFIDSGVFEVTPGGALDPEPDTTTYNGSVWLLARRTYWRDVNTPPDTSSREWKLAADFYVRRAYGEAFRWSWRNAQLEYDEYHRLIRRSNDSNRKSLQDLGAILANHVFSTVDAYVTVRIRRRPVPGVGGSDGWEFGAALPLATLFRH